MKLLITGPIAIAVEAADVVSLRAEDASGSFGVLTGHADFLTALSISVVSWRHTDGHAGYCAVRGGILTITGGYDISIATREAHVGDNLDQLETVVLADYHSHIECERTERTASARLRMQAIRHMVQALDGGPKAIGL